MDMVASMASRDRRENEKKHILLRYLKRKIAGEYPVLVLFRIKDIV
jgi:hypothetical protein